MSHAHVSVRTACRLCGHTELAEVLDLGPQHLHGQFPAAGEPDPPAAPLVVCRCTSPLCGLVQAKYTVDPAAHCSKYWYQSGVSQTMRNHLKAVAEEACEMLMGRVDGATPNPPVAPRVCDIGGNDGCTLNAIPVATGNRTLIDPSDVPVAHPGIRHLQAFFPDGVMLTQQFDLILSLACFYSCNDPVKFAKAVKQVLAPDGLWVVEVADLAAVLRNVDIGYWASEHVCLYSLHGLTEIAKRAKLKVVRYEPSPANGGSMRVYMTHQFSSAYPFVGGRSTAIGEKWSEGLRLAADGSACAEFAAKARDVIAAVRSVVRLENAGGGTVHLMAASTKSGVLLQAAGLKYPDIRMASDRDPRKVGRRMPGLGVEIVGEETSRAYRPSLYVCLMPASFHEELLARERAAGTTADFLFAMPTVRRVSLREPETARAA